VNQVEMEKNEGHVLNETHPKWEIILYSHFKNQIKSNQITTYKITCSLSFLITENGGSLTLFFPQ
jgi:hypothetical protein